MAVQVIYTDSAELILLLKGNAGRENHSIKAADIQRVSFSNVEVSKLFGLIKSQTRRITVICKKLGTIEFDETRHKEFFETYLTDLRQFCHNNHVTFYDFADK